MLIIFIPLYVTFSNKRPRQLKKIYVEVTFQENINSVQPIVQSIKVLFRTSIIFNYKYLLCVTLEIICGLVDIHIECNYRASGGFSADIHPFHKIHLYNTVWSCELSLP